MKCPSCGSARVYPSRLRSILEKWWQGLSGKQPYRCHQCGWRRWRELTVLPENPDVHPDDLRTGRRSSPVSPSDLEELDPLTPES
jgi:hypothetical protein